MHFDDRLATVLRLPVNGDGLARTQFRQLLDILGRMAPGAQGPQIDAAFARLAELNRAIPAAERAGMLRDPAIRLRSPRLLAALADCEPQVATAAFARADLAEADWLGLIPDLPVRARGIVRHRRDLGPGVEALLERLGIADRGLPPAASTQLPPLPVASAAEKPPAKAPAPAPQASPPIAAPGESDADIAALLRRIEEFSKSRGANERPLTLGHESPRLPLEELLEAGPAPHTRAFDFATDAEGRIVWANPEIAPMVAGLRFTASDSASPLRGTSTFADAIRHRQPIRNASVAIEGAPAISGGWQVDAAPNFDAISGRFNGYEGRFRRPFRPPPDSLNHARSAEADRMRQILHELRTPANAIQIAAEIIQQNLFGEIPHEYRALAASIASDTAQILAGFDELDRLVKLESGAMSLIEGECDVASLTAAIVSQLEAFGRKRGSGFASSGIWPPLPVGIARPEGERLIWRLLAGLAGSSAPGECLAIECTRKNELAMLCVELPGSLAGYEGDALFTSHPDRSDPPLALSASAFGIAFSLRLAAAEARGAGGKMQRNGKYLALALPLLSEDRAVHRA